MQLRPIAIYDDIDPEIFKRDFYEPGTPVVIKNLAKQWPAYSKWNWDYFKKLVGDTYIGHVKGSLNDVPECHILCWTSIYNVGTPYEVVSYRRHDVSWPIHLQPQYSRRYRHLL